MSAPVPCHWCNMWVEPDAEGPGVHATHPAVKQPWVCELSADGRHLIVKPARYRGEASGE